MASPGTPVTPAEMLAGEIYGTLFPGGFGGTKLLTHLDNLTFPATALIFNFIDGTAITVDLSLWNTKLFTYEGTIV